MANMAIGEPQLSQQRQAKQGQKNDREGIHRLYNNKTSAAGLLV
jgi:hypothetical protein